jgi:putative endonuclease
MASTVRAISWQVCHGMCQLSARRSRRLASNRHSAQHTRQEIARSVRPMSSDARHRLGRLGEQLAAEHLVRRGFRIIERNYRTRWGELDIVAFDGTTLAFCEVKTRRLAPATGTPFDALRYTKRSRVRKMACSWLVERTERPRAEVLRFDAIGVTFDPSGELVGIEHLEGAF